MVKVITYGTYDLLHYGHIRLLERAKALGDYLIVGVTADDFDKTRGKINVKQSLMERIEAVRATGLADEIIIEEYEGQKIDDIRRYGVDIFTVGSDWIGKFDYLNEYCKVVYLDRTEGVSSSSIREDKRKIRLGLVGDKDYLRKFANECHFVNGIEVIGVCADKSDISFDGFDNLFVTNNLSELLEKVDACYVISHPSMHYDQIKECLLNNKHVLCEAPITLKESQSKELIELARQKNLILMQGLKTAYSTAYSRLMLLIKTGKIGDVIAVDSTCTSLRNPIVQTDEFFNNTWNTICAWGPTALLPVLQILGTDYKSKQIITKFADEKTKYDLFTKIDFVYDNAVASIKVAKGVKSEGELVISGTKGYIYVPSPWWKTDYFEIRYENPQENKRYFYQLDGEGIRYEIVAFAKAVETGKSIDYIVNDILCSMSEIMESYYDGDVTVLK